MSSLSRNTPPGICDHYDNFADFSKEWLERDVVPWSVAMHYQIHPSQHFGDKSSVEKFYKDFVSKGNRRIGHFLMFSQRENDSEQRRQVDAFKVARGVGETVFTATLTHTILGSLQQHAGTNNPYLNDWLYDSALGLPGSFLSIHHNYANYPHDTPDTVVFMSYKRQPTSDSTDSEVTLDGCDVYTPPFPPGLHQYVSAWERILSHTIQLSAAANSTT